MTLFTQELVPSHENPESVRVTYTPPASSTSASGGEAGLGAEKKTIDIPLHPDVSALVKVDALLHNSPTATYVMPAATNEWFSSCFGFPVQLLHLGPHYRPVLGSLNPNSAQNKSQSNSQSPSWLSSMTDYLPVPLATLVSNTTSTSSSDENATADKTDSEITFADVAPYLLVTTESLASVSSRLPPTEAPMDMTKFRPNIVLAGSDGAWDEDFWAELEILPQENGEGQGVKIQLTGNCARCKSINIDYSTGDFGAGESGKVLKKLMADRRVDPGSKWSPIFGRYGFLEGKGNSEASVALGDAVKVVKRQEERSVFVWPGLGTAVS